MSRFVMDMPDDFKNEMLKRKIRTGIGFRFQVINALRKEFGWDEGAMPIDARYSVLPDVPEPKTNGHTPKNQPLDGEGLPDFSYGMDRAEAAESFMQETSSGPATHPDDAGKKIPTGTEGKDKMLSDLQRKIEEEF